MGAWGCRAFENDETLDAVDALCSFDGTINALYRAVYLSKQEIIHDAEFEIAYGACEIIAAGAGAPQGPLSAEADKAIVDLTGSDAFSQEDSAPRLPEEVVEWLAEDDDERPEFTLEHVQLALQVVDLLAEPERLREWRDPGQRLAALAQTRWRLAEVGAV